MSLIARMREVYREGGIGLLVRRAAHFVYNELLRPHLPYTTVKFNGVTVRGVKFLDRYVPWQRDDRPTYETGIVNALQTHVEEGDSVVVVGGGWGVSAVHAARQVCEEGEVRVFEGSREMVQCVRETAALNDVGARVDVTNAVVGQDVDVWGEAAGDVVHPTDLPECDVLVMDCEGAETTILREMSIRPEVIVVETHGVYDAPTNEVSEILKNVGYTIKNEALAEPDLEAICREKDIKVLTATR